MLRLGEGLASVEKNIPSIFIPVLGLLFLEHFRVGSKGPLRGARFSKRLTCPNVIKQLDDLTVTRQPIHTD